VESSIDFWARPLPVTATVLSKKEFYFFKNHENFSNFSNFFRFGFGLGKQLIFGPNLASDGNPSFQKINFIFLKIMRIFLIFFALVLG
jgi:hypothetical protein